MNAVLRIAGLLAVAGTLALPASAFAAANDNFASASNLGSVATVSGSGDTTGATAEVGEPHPFSAISHSIWYQWRAPQGGSAAIDLCGSAYDTTLAVYTGASYASPLREVGRNDDSASCSSGSLQSRVAFPVTGGEIYRIQVDGFNGATGLVTLHIALTGPATAPINDNLSAAQAISGATAYASGGNIGATREAAEPATIGPAPVNTSVWYAWTAPVAGNVTLDTCGSDFDTVLGVYRGTSFPLEFIAGNDDVSGVPGCSGLNSSVTFPVRGGEQFRLAVSGYSSRTGHIELHLALASDTTPPDTTLAASGPTGTVNATSASFAFSSSETRSTFQCAVDSAAYAPCTSPATLTGLADGPHTFHVRALDTSNNIDPTPAVRTWTIDSTPPETTITSGPSGSVNATSASFAFSSNEGGSTFQCSLDGGTPVTCTSPATYTGLADGAHTFGVRATDAVGNAEAPTAPRTWTVDTAAPATTITSGPSGSTEAVDATLAFTSGESGSTYACSLDDSAFAPCSSPKAYSGLGVGAHAFSVKATDEAGNTGPPATRSWTVAAPPPPAASSTPSGGTLGESAHGQADKTPPVLTAAIVGQKLKAVLAKGLKVSLGSSEAASIKCKLMLDGNAAKRLGLAKSAKPVTVGTCSAALDGKTAKVIAIKVSAKAVKAFKKLARVKLGLQAIGTDGAGNSSTLSRSVTVKR